MADITIVGGDALVKSISQRVSKDKVNHRIKKRTSDLQNEAMRRVPVDTGALKRSLTIDLWPERLTGSVSATMEYAPYVEFGTRFQTSKPYMRPSRDKVTPLFISDMRNLLKEGG